MLITNTMLFVIYYVGYLKAIIESFSIGVYKNGIIYPEYSTSWTDLEGYLILDGKIRFVHKTKGAFDLEATRDQIQKTQEYIKGHLKNLDF